MDPTLELNDAEALRDFKLNMVENKVVAPIAPHPACPKNFLLDALYILFLFAIAYILYPFKLGVILYNYNQEKSSSDTKQVLLVYHWDYLHPKEFVSDLEHPS